MIRASIEITADTPDHFQKIVDQVNEHLKRNEQAEGWWVYPGSYHKIARFDYERPLIVCLCGSTRFSEAYQRANLEETLAGRIILTIGCDMKHDGELFDTKTDLEREQIKAMLDDLHKRKIDLCDEVLVLNVGGYIGNSTRGEIEYAKAHNKHIRWLEPQST